MSPKLPNDKLVVGHNIGVKLGERWIFRYVDVEVNRGELVLIIGANGAGKTTFAKSILGLIEVSEGTIKRADSIKTGYVPQRLSVSVTLPLTMRRLMTLTGRYTQQKIDRTLSAVGLHRLGDPPVTTLSGGEFQRLLLARAMIDRPDLLVLDEPVQGVDIAGSGRLYELIEEIKEELNCGVLMISHDHRKFFEIGDDYVVLVPHEHDQPPQDDNNAGANFNAG